MGLFELFKQKQVKIIHEEPLQINYLTMKTVTELYTRAYGDILLVKRQLTKEDAVWLNNQQGSCTVFSTEPKTLEAYDARKDLSESTTVITH